jgi:hypothetical protein
MAGLDPDIFVDAATRALFPWEERYSASAVLRDFRPMIRTVSGAELSLRFRPLRRGFYHTWPGGRLSGRRG